MSSKIPLAEIYDDVASVINGQETRTFSWAGHWYENFKIVEMAPGARIIVQEHDGLEISAVPIEHVANKIVTWLRKQPDPETLLTYSQGKEAAQTWAASAPALATADIKLVSWASEPGHTWRRLPWDRSDGPTPTWDKIFSKMTNGAAFRQWIGALFFEEARQHQYVWVHGMGNDGKGCINRFLKRVFGRSYRSKQPPAPGDKFWTYGLIGSRLVVFPDCNSQGFTTGGMFKSLSGGDPVDVEAKGRMSFTAEPHCKFLFFSNEKPNVSCEDADMRRIIYCEFFEKTKKEDDDPRFEDRLWTEGGYFLSRCVLEYLEACPGHTAIASSKEDIEAWVSVGEEEFQNIFDQHFMIPKNEAYRTTSGLSELTPEQLDLVTVEPTHMLAVIKEAFTDQKTQARFRDWLYKKFGAQKKSIRRGEVVFYRYVGLHRLLTNEAAGKLSRKLALLRNKASTPSTVDTVTS